MRKAYQAELDRFTDELADLTGCAETAIAQATTALVEGDVSLAEAVITAEPAIRERHHRLDNEAFGLLARQQPVATDLRILVAGLRMSVDLERMGVLARHVAEIVVKRHPHHVVPPSMNGTLAAMGKIAQRLAGEARTVLKSRDAEQAMELAAEDDEMDQLQESLHRQLLEPQRGVDLETAMDIVLLGRHYERFADHAVSVGKRVAFIVRGAQAEPTAH